MSLYCGVEEQLLAFLKTLYTAGTFHKHGMDFSFKKRFNWRQLSVYIFKDNNWDFYLVLISLENSRAVIKILLGLCSVRRWQSGKAVVRKFQKIACKVQMSIKVRCLNLKRGCLNYQLTILDPPVILVCKEIFPSKSTKSFNNLISNVKI